MYGCARRVLPSESAGTDADAAAKPERQRQPLLDPSLKPATYLLRSSSPMRFANSSASIVWRRRARTCVSDRTRRPARRRLAALGTTRGKLPVELLCTSRRCKDGSEHGCSSTVADATLQRARLVDVARPFLALMIENPSIHTSWTWCWAGKPLAGSSALNMGSPRGGGVTKSSR